MQRIGSTRLGVIGLGDLGRFHARNVLERLGTVELAWVADLDPDLARAVGDELQVPWTDCIERLLDDPDVHGVVIATPTSTHPDLIARAADAGKHVFTEKPIGLDVESTERAIAAGDAARVVLQVGFHRRFDADFRAAAKRVAAGDLGRPYFLRLAHRDMVAPRPGSYLNTNGPLVVDSMIHDFDTARWLVGEVAEVSARATSVSDPAFAASGDADHAVVVLHFDDGALGAVDNCRLAGYGYECSAELIGSEGTIRITEPQRGNLAWLANGTRSTPFPRDHMERHGPAYVAELHAFARAIREERPSPVPGDEGLRAFRISEAAAQSLREERPVPVVQGRERIAHADA